MTGLEVSAHWGEGICVLKLEGEARLETVQRLDAVTAEVFERGVDGVLMDMTRLDFMDSASTGALLRLHNQVSERGGSLVLFGLKRVIQRLLEHSGLKERFACATDEDEARRMVSSS